MTNWYDNAIDRWHERYYDLFDELIHFGREARESCETRLVLLKWFGDFQDLYYEIEKAVEEFPERRDEASDEDEDDQLSLPF